MSHSRSNRISFLGSIAMLALMGVARLVGQTVTLNGSFTGSTLDSGWVVGGSGYTPVLTASTAGGNTDSVGSGWLQMTSSAGNQATYAYDSNSFSAANATITATFNYASFNGTGADGITFFLADASQTFGVGAYGGSLGYAQKTAAGGGGADINGMNGGYIGVGIDEFGNYSNPTEGRVGGIGSTPNAIAVRGPGQGLTGYNYLGGTGNLGTNSIAFPGSTTRPTGANQRTLEVVITATNQMTVYMASGGSGNFIPLYSIDLSGYTRPSNLIMGFTAGTGGSTDVHQVQNVTLTRVVSNLWTNGSTNSAWGTATNWNNTPANVPAVGSDILLDNTFVNTAQNISVVGNQVIRNLQIDAPFSYTLTGGSLEFNGSAAIGPSGILVSQTHGSATQTIGSNLTLDNAIQIQNNSSAALALTGNVNLGNYTATLNGNGYTTISGVVSGTGTGAKIVQSGTGDTTLSGNNTYSGGTTLSAGTLTVNNNNALGTGGLTITGGTLNSTNASSIGNIVTLQGNAAFANVTTSGNLTQAGGNYTLNLAGVNQSGTVALSNSTTNQTLTVQVDSGSSNISGAITNGNSTGSGLTKTGSGNLILSGASTYTGATTINGGSITLGGNGVLANTTALTIGSSGTLSLNGYSQKVGALTASGGAAIDYGTGTNTFVFGNYTPPASGVLVINNFSGSDVLATTQANITTGNLATIYVSGVGVVTSEASTLTNYTSTLASLGSAYPLTATSTTGVVWAGTGTTWNATTDWVGGARPSTTQIAIFNAVGASNLTSSFNYSRTIAGIEFDTTAPGYTVSAGGGTLTLAGTVPYIQQKSSANQTVSPPMVLSNTTVMDITGSGYLTINGTIATGNTVNLIRDGAGSGKLILAGNNTGMTGQVYINTGILQAQNTNALGTNTTNIASGGALELSGGISPTNNITVIGTGVGAGAINNFSGVNTLSGTITTTGDTTIGAATGTTLTLSNTTGVTGTGNVTFAPAGTGVITVNAITTTGGAGVTITGGTVNYNGTTTPNTYTGTTTVNSGTLALNKTAGTIAIAGNLVINGGTVNETTSNQISTNSSISISSGSLNLANGVTNTFPAISSNTGSTLSLGTGASANISSSVTNTLNGNITGAGSLATGGTGSLILGGNNSYTGGTTIASIVSPITNSAFGTGNVTVNSGGSIETQNTISVANNFTINSTGTTAYNGAIENISGNTTLNGTVTLTGSSRLQSDSGTLTATNTVALAGNTLNVGGNGNVTINGLITGTAASSLTKDGTGTLTLGASNTGFAGSVLVSAGTLVANATNTFNSSNAISIINTSSILNLNGLNETVASLTSSGTLALGSGSTLTLSGGGTNTLGGNITGSGTIIIGPGASLTLGANFNDPNVNIVLNGGTLNLNGTTDTFGTLNVTAGGSILDFASSANSTLNVSNVTLGSNTLTVNNWTNLQDYFYSTNFTGVTPNARGTAPENQIVFSGFSAANTAWLSNDHQITPAPEPATYGMIFVGLSLAAVGVRRLRRHRTAA